MKHSKIYLVCILFCALASTQALDIGDRLIRDYTKYYSLPSTAPEATASGWVSNGTCIPGLGVAYSANSSTPTATHPITLFFTPAGQAAGIGVTVFGSVQENLVKHGFYIQTGKKQYFIAVSFRSSDQVCSDAKLEEYLGDRLVVNQNSIAVNIPVLESDAAAARWVKGACFETMGYHYSFDIQNAGSPMSWQAANLLPVVPMYDNGSINAIFFASTSMQQALGDARMWDPVPIPNLLMCKNWCDSKCTFHGTLIWSTMHIYFKDYKKVTCPNDCTISCCDA